MGIGDRISQWLLGIPLATWILAYKDHFLERLHELENIGASVVEQAGFSDYITIGLPLLATMAVYLITGIRFPLDALLYALSRQGIQEFGDFYDNPQAWMLKHLRELGESAEAKAFTEFVGGIVTEPVLSLFETYAGRENPDPKEFARAFHGIATGLPWAAAQVDNLLKLPLGARAPKLGENITQIYWGLGLGFLGWQTLAPLLSSGLQPNLERYYNRLYRPARFNPSQARDIFALGLWSADQMGNYLRDLGWRDDDIQTWLDVSYRDLSEGLLWDLYDRGLISRSEQEKRLRKLGYNPTDLDLVFKGHQKADTEDASKYLLSTAKNALKKHIISEGEFRDILSGLNYAPREIELQISLINTQQTNELRDLTTGQIRELYETRIIGRSEAVTNLVQIQFAPDVAEQLVKAWDAEALPKAARLNKGTITDAYNAGVLARDEAKGLLVRESGYSDQNAELVLKTEDAQQSGAGSGMSEGGPAVSLSTLVDFAQNGLITRTEFGSRTELARFTPVDRDRITQLAFSVPVEAPRALGPDALLDAFRLGVISADVLRERLLALGASADDVNILIASQREQLSPSLVGDAYVAGVISREDLLSRLRGYGLNDEDAEIFVRTLEVNNPAVFGEFTGRFVKRASVGSLQLALQRGMIDEVQFTDRLSTQGYSPDAIAVYLFNAQYQQPANPKQLSKADILSLYQNGQFTRSQALSRLQQIGYTIEDATLLVDQREVAIEDTEIGQAFLAGYIDELSATAALLDQGWSEDDIFQFFLRVGTEGL